MSSAPLTIEELRHEIMVATGAAVIAIQFFELYASGCLLALRGRGSHSPEDLLSGDPSRRLPTLRVLVSRLYEHFPVAPAFQERLNAFIEDRNILIHRFFISDLAQQPVTVEAYYKKLEFILRVMREATALKPVFAGLYSLLHKAQVAAGEITPDSDLTQYTSEQEQYESDFISILRATVA